MMESARARFSDRLVAERVLLNALTIDLEDWGQAVLDSRMEVTAHVVDNTLRLLDLLDHHHVTATFFALGRVCERFPRLLPTIRAAGHEVASHGYGHELIYTISPDAFEEDVRLSMEIIADQTGQLPLGYRAPAFSITDRSRWAGPILADLGFQYSSSVFPISGRRYGIPGAPRHPHRWTDCDLIELPPATVRLFGHNYPACGGGYTRLLPAPVMSHFIRRMNRAGMPAVLYLHPYELAPGEVTDFQQSGSDCPWSRRFTQELWRSRVPARVGALLGTFRFGTMSEVLRELNLVPLPERHANMPPAPTAHAEAVCPAGAGSIS